MNLRQLKFHRIDPAEAPELSCDFCGGNHTSSSWLMADIPLGTNGADHLSIVFCSTVCRTKFISHPGCKEYIEASIQRVKSTRKALPPEPDYPPEMIAVISGALRNTFGDVEIEIQRKGSQLLFIPKNQ